MKNSSFIIIKDKIVISAASNAEARRVFWHLKKQKDAKISWFQNNHDEVVLPVVSTADFINTQR